LIFLGGLRYSGYLASPWWPWVCIAETPWGDKEKRGKGQMGEEKEEEGREQADEEMRSCTGIREHKGGGEIGWPFSVVFPDFKFFAVFYPAFLYGFLASFVTTVL